MLAGVARWTWTAVFLLATAAQSWSQNLTLTKPIMIESVSEVKDGDPDCISRGSISEDGVVFYQGYGVEKDKPGLNFWTEKGGLVKNRYVPPGTVNNGTAQFCSCSRISSNGMVWSYWQTEKTEESFWDPYSYFEEWYLDYHSKGKYCLVELGADGQGRLLEEQAVYWDWWHEPSGLIHQQGRMLDMEFCAVNGLSQGTGRYCEIVQEDSSAEPPPMECNIAYFPQNQMTGQILDSVVPEDDGEDWGASGVDINEEGTVLAAVERSSVKEARVYMFHNPRNTFTIVGGSDPQALNNDDWVVGGLEQPWVWNHEFGLMRLPLPDGVTKGAAVDINDSGLIVGMAGGRAAAWQVSLVTGEDGARSLKLKCLKIQSPSDDIDVRMIYAINNCGEMLVKLKDKTGWCTAYVKMTEQLLAVDAQRDGVTHFEDDDDVIKNRKLSDLTTSQKPYVFWINDDHDADGSERPNGPPDWKGNRIGSERNLEDFSRLMIRSDDFVRRKINQGYSLQLEQTGGPRVNLYKAATMSKETDYLAIKRSASDQTDGALNRAVQTQHLEKYLNSSDYDKGRALFLWEGCREGTGTLRLKLCKPDGSEESHSDVCVRLAPVAKMFEQARGTPTNGFAPPYETDGQVPGVGLQIVQEQKIVNPGETPQCIVLVHGWRNEEWEKRTWSETFYKRLWHAGYKGRFAFFSWPTYAADNSTLWAVQTYNESEFRAFKYAAALRSYLGQLKARLPAYTINVAAHSMGNVVTGEALREGAPVDNYVLMQAAISAGCYDTRNNLLTAPFLDAERKESTPDGAAEMGYRGYLSGIRSNLVNFYNEQDYALRTGASNSWSGERGYWEENNIHFKPKPINPMRHYGFTMGVAGIYDLVWSDRALAWKLGRRVTDPMECMAYVARSRTRAVGGEPQTCFAGNKLITGQPIRARVDLSASFGFTRQEGDHSAQFTRPIQNQMLPFYQRLCSELRVIEKN